MGRGGSLDNETSGGIHCRIGHDGMLEEYALDKYGTKYTVHPDTKTPFNRMIPELEKLKNQSLRVAEKLFYTRIAGLDACYDRDGNWRMIEVNTNSHTIRSSQYWGVPFFREFTDEVIEHCTKNHWALKDG